jgi:hypothetical protein
MLLEKKYEKAGLLKICQYFILCAQPKDENKDTSNFADDWCCVLLRLYGRNC